MSDIYAATEKMAVGFQEYAARSYAEARLWLDGADKYAPRVRHHQNCAAMYSAEARMRLFRLIGTE